MALSRRAPSLIRKGEKYMEENIEIKTLPQTKNETAGDLDDLIFQGEGWLASDR